MSLFFFQTLKVTHLNVYEIRLHIYDYRQNTHTRHMVVYTLSKIPVSSLFSSKLWLEDERHNFFDYYLYNVSPKLMLSHSMNKSLGWWC